MKTDIHQIADLLIRLYNFDISRYDTTFLEKSFGYRMKETLNNSLSEYKTYIEHNSGEGKNFLDSLNISYSQFFRNSLTFSVLERIILPRIYLEKKNSRRKEIRIWSVASAAGQEPYSLAILLEELKVGENEKINYRIFASDQSETQIKNALNGKFSEADVGNLNVKRIEKWLIKRDDNYFIRPELKKNIDFSVFDLFVEQLGCPPESIFGDFDIVVCANLLFYYKKDEQKTILKKASNCITTGGYLISGETEREILLNNNFIEVYPQSAIFRISDFVN